ncbi:hypothetical protein [Actinomadura formosensis]|uniref:hypothetical protein n=1 Tax=Actinomadura formosensis TaxID=60706 RepID=UPI003D947427
MSVIAWTCKRCAHHAEDLSVEEFVALDNEHACKPEDELRRAAAYCRRRSGEATPLLGTVADWLEHVAATWAFHRGPTRNLTLAIARATPWEEP